MLKMTGSKSDDVGTVQILVRDQIHLAPRVCRLFNAYLEANQSRRADFRKAVAYASHWFGYDSPATPSLQEDIIAALAIAQEAADIAYSADIDEMINGAGLGSVDSGILVGAFATLALGYRYVVGFYTTDPTLGDLGKVAVDLVLLAEREHDSAFVMTNVAPQARPTMMHNAFRADQKLASSLSIFVPPEVDRKENGGISLEAISRRLKDQILLMA
jgi:hypothetical protein